MGSERTYAAARALTNETKIYYGIIDGQDTARILTAYADHFS